MNNDRNNKIVALTNKEFVYRNKLAIDVFSKLGLDVRLSGNPLMPIVVYKENMKLPVSFNGFIMTIYDKFKESSSRVTINLKKFDLDETRTKFMEICELMEKKPVYRIQMNSSIPKLFIKEFQKQSDKSHPVFSTIDAKVYHEKQYAEEIAIELGFEGFENLSVI